ncbi:NitT/TauT family transport system ATP-binding protein/sulfonate transport system ATP-binding protein [Pseudomonas protegens]|jgi:ABC-type nitrate/sulfonate/bicarbonate transport system ATPase subunit|uniref:ABC transporter ATP-binding protein n=1 Tax=Pseudomonas TaxID=286 RepID=UPI000F4A1079|nr:MULTISPECIES: ABC transporter ATP-binding protein [Pseudomonas]MBF0643348.1 ABC transporter ATP-binding protein [Pseudomonas protegens]MCS4259034.1 NitT/TauT family transport system ATP-binding protein/sulfonate transport system ATP-binding protein [Pseudomonas sp. BIGb0176]MDK1397144.1 ABC transporter ATP-binding protein [Pseudomonas protegens]MDS9873846.1 ABC transporter ATP-binding protein [Pseudomonas protegens]MDT3420607.1 ABC-type nitrate/sulfonate/bicarbonate transport system ATPase 
MNAIAQHAPLPTHLLARTGALQLRGLNKSYRIQGQALPVLQGIDLDVQPGEFVSIVGASGCGKSTLLRLIVGLEGDYQGQMLLDGKPVTGTSLERGIVFQDHRLFPWMTLAQNIALALKNHPLSEAEKQRRVAEHIALVNLQGFEQAYPHQLSGGMAQRGAIARALINQPKVLLLDEPLGALDALTRVRLQHELQRIWVQQRCTVIMVTHDIEEALYLGDRVIVMDAHPGRIKHEIRVDLPHPRDRSSPVLQGYKEQLLEELVGH